MSEDGFVGKRHRLSPHKLLMKLSDLTYEDMETDSPTSTGDELIVGKCLFSSGNFSKLMYTDHKPGRLLSRTISNHGASCNSSRATPRIPPLRQTPREAPDPDLE